MPYKLSIVKPFFVAAAKKTRTSNFSSRFSKYCSSSCCSSRKHWASVWLIISGIWHYPIFMLQRLFKKNLKYISDKVRLDNQELVVAHQAAALSPNYLTLDNTYFKKGLVCWSLLDICDCSWTRLSSTEPSVISLQKNRGKAMASNFSSCLKPSAVVFPWCLYILSRAFLLFSLCCWFCSDSPGTYCI